jgi:hypothetical protein
MTTKITTAVVSVGAIATLALAQGRSRGSEIASSPLFLHLPVPRKLSP